MTLLLPFSILPSGIDPACSPTRPIPLLTMPLPPRARLFTLLSILNENLSITDSEASRSIGPGGSCRSVRAKLQSICFQSVRLNSMDAFMMAWGGGPRGGRCQREGDMATAQVGRARRY